MKKLMTTAALAALLLSGCAAPFAPAPTPAPDDSALSPAARKAALQAQSRGLRTKIVELKQQVVVFEVMLTDVERRAAMSQTALSNLPNTNLNTSAVPAAAPVAARRDADRLSVSVRPAPDVAPAPKAADKRKRPARKQP